MIDLSGHNKPALQFSGGKDSLACLYLLRAQLDDITVYWLNTGDAYPETVDVIEQVKPWIPRFIEIKADVKGFRAINGNPSDLMPANAHPIAIGYGLGELPLVNRFDCCWQNRMRPMHQRMLDDGVDLVIRGTKQADTGTVPAEGVVANLGYDIALPIRDWSHKEVFAYLDEVGAPRNAIYGFPEAISAPECVGCTAWWGEGHSAHLKARHPGAYQSYRIHLTAIAATLQSHLDELQAELKTGA